MPDVTEIVSEQGRGPLVESGNDAKIIRRAANDPRFKFPDEVRDNLVGDLHAFFKDSTQDSRARVNAAKTLATLDALNQADEHKAQGDGAPGSVTFEQISRMRVAR